MENKKTSFMNKFRGIDWAIILSVIALFATSIYFLGQFSERINSAHDKIEDLNERVNYAGERLDNIFEEIKEAQKNSIKELNKVSSLQDNPIVLSNGKLGSGLDMLVATSEDKTNWVSFTEKAICMSYPSGQEWGAVLITIGKPTNAFRPSKSFSKYKKLVVELKGEKGGETVLIGLKDKNDPDDGSEDRTRLNLSNNWQAYEIDLQSNFGNTDLQNLSVVTEFVFERIPQNVCVRKIFFK